MRGLDSFSSACYLKKSQTQQHTAAKQVSLSISSLDFSLIPTTLLIALIHSSLAKNITSVLQPVIPNPTP